MFPLPKDFLNSLKNVPDFKEDAFLAPHETQKLPVSLRLNPFKRAELDYELTEIPWTENGFYLKERPVFTADPLFHAGCYYVQEASSMFIEFVLKELINFDQELKALDLCAAPGGKTTILSSLLSKESLLVANEVVKNRADVLAYNLAKWGNSNHVVTSNESASFAGYTGLFDIALIDAPCSGSGLFRKQPEAINEWSVDAVLQCSNRQRGILADIVPTLKSGGLLIYSTCSYSVEENENIVEWLLNEFNLELVQLQMPKEWGIEDSGLGYRFYPYNLEGEGFFCSVLRKTDDTPSIRMNAKNTFKEPTKEEKSILDHFMDPGFNSVVINHNDEFKLLNTNILNFINLAKGKLYFKQAGTSIGEIKHRDLIPHHFLALSNYIKDDVEVLELSKNELLKYLKKETFLYETASHGLKLISYKGFGTGWAKVLPNRVNNYLPLNFMIFNKEIGLSK